jgi:hypothetical protein
LRKGRKISLSVFPKGSASDVDDDTADGLVVCLWSFRFRRKKYLVPGVVFLGFLVGPGSSDLNHSKLTWKMRKSNCFEPWSYFTWGQRLVCGTKRGHLV